MTARTPEQAAEWLCPLARTFAASPSVKGCQGASCALWRWEPVSTSNPLWRAAVKAEAEKTGEKAPFPKAARVVADDLEAFGIKVERGYCGMGGPI